MIAKELQRIAMEAAMTGEPVELPKTNARHERRFEMERTHTLMTEGWTRSDGSKAKLAPESPSTSKEVFRGLRMQGLLSPPSMEVPGDEYMRAAVNQQLRNKLKAERKKHRR